MKHVINVILVTAFVSAILGCVQSNNSTEKYQFILIGFIALAGILGTNFNKK